MKTLHKICLSVVLVMTGLALVSEQEAFCAERGASGRGQRSRGGQRDVWSFEADKAGAVPRDWKVAETRGKGTPATWQVVEDDSAPDGTQAVAITANENRGSTYNLMIAQDTSYRDLVIRIKVKAVTGKQDQGGGPIWRAKDGDNYYIARWNPLEDNFRLYYVKGGRRIQLASADVKTDPKAWHEILIVHRANRIIASFDGKRMIEVEDTTFSDAGKVGLWTKADAATKFDNLTVFSIRSRGPRRMTFDRDEVGSVPRGWKVAETKGKGTPATWQVVEDSTAPSALNVVAITANKNRGSTYNLLIAERTRYGDLSIKVKVKAGTGKEDQGGGPIWRAKDFDNYYIARWNPLEDNFRLYYVKDGRRIQLGSAEVKTDPKAWHEIKIDHRGTKIVASFDGKKMIELEDSTFSEPGMVGLWTKADAATAFDDLMVYSGIRRTGRTTFDRDEVGSVPRGWKVAETGGEGKLATWQVMTDTSAPSPPQAVAITANKNYGRTFNLLMAQGTSYGDLEIKVMVKAIAGEEDQGGGPIWRAKDADNYYICRWNPLENNFRIYFVKNGRRKQLGTAEVKTDAKIWHEVRIVHKGTQITAYFDGEKMIELEDSTFSEPGMVGLWVKADGRTAFDDFSPRRILND